MRQQVNPRLAALLAFVSEAIAQGNMTSTCRLGWPSDDLKSLKASMETLKLDDTQAYRDVAQRLEDEFDDPYEEDESEVVAQG